MKLWAIALVVLFCCAWMGEGGLAIPFAEIKVGALPPLPDVSAVHLVSIYGGWSAPPPPAPL